MAFLRERGVVRSPAPSVERSLTPVAGPPLRGCLGRPALVVPGSQARKLVEK